MPYLQQWDLSKIFAKGTSDSPELQSFVAQIKKDIKACKKEEDLAKIIGSYQDLIKRFREAESYVVCLAAQDVSDATALAWQNKMTAIHAKIHAISIELEKILLSTPDPDFENLIKKPPLDEIAFALREIRDFAKEKLGPTEEQLISDLSVDGYHGWSQIYDLQIGDMTFHFQGEELSFGQIENKMSDPKREVRRAAFTTITSEFKKKQHILAEILNHLGGFRLQMYQHRNWDQVIKEPLHENRMSLPTLDVMWDVIEKNKTPLVEYLRRKAKLLGLEKLSWFDLEAPLQNVDLTYTYDTAAKFIIDHFRSFSPKMAEFAEKALTEGWIEAEDRSGKKPGGFCIDFPIAEQSRIFMTFSGTFTNVSTLAHELGHAFHSHVMRHLPELATHYRMNVAETASTMAEMIVIDAAIRSAKRPEEKLALLDDKISRSIAFLMNLHARYLFEMRFYEKRKMGFCSAEDLCTLMEEAQKEAYKEELDLYHPLFWAAKLHFYFTDVPFYNFPYTFGYLFSLGLYNEVKTRRNFEEQYILLLQDSGRMTTEDLAKKYLNIDLAKPQFWQNALDIIHQDIEHFLKL